MVQLKMASPAAKNSLCLLYGSELAHDEFHTPLKRQWEHKLVCNVWAQVKRCPFLHITDDAGINCLWEKPFGVVFPWQPWSTLHLLHWPVKIECSFSSPGPRNITWVIFTEWRRSPICAKFTSRLSKATHIKTVNQFSFAWKQAPNLFTIHQRLPKHVT